MTTIFSFLVSPHSLDNATKEAPKDPISVAFTYNGYDQHNFSATIIDGDWMVHLCGREAQRAWMKIQQPGTRFRVARADHFGRIHPYRVVLEISRARMVRLGYLPA